MNDPKAASSSDIRPSDVGIIACCLLSIAHRIQVFASLRGNGLKPLAASNTGPYHDPAQPIEVNVPVEDHTTLGIGSRNVAHASINLDVNDSSTLQPPDNTTTAALNRNAELPSYEYVTDYVNECEGEGLFMRFMELPLTLRIIVATHWLSVISNCLTYYLRPSQVLYAFLTCSCDLILYMIVETNPTRVRRCRTQLSNPTSIVSSQPGTEQSSVCHGPLTVKEQGILIVDARREMGSTNFNVREDEIASRLETVVQTSPLGVERGVVLEPWIDFRNGSQRGTFIIMINLALVCVLVIFHIHRLFFVVGTVAGYLACWGTLYVFSCEFGTLLALLAWIRAKRASLCLPAQVSRKFMDLSALPPFSVVSNRRLAVHHMLYVFLSLVCSTLYYSMLGEEGPALYSTHVEFMRWYVNIYVQGITDVVRMLIFWAVYIIGSGRDGKTWHRHLYDINSRVV